MDIIASMLAYLFCMTGLVTGLVMSAVIFFSPPQLQGQLADRQTEAPPVAAAMMVRPSSSAPTKSLAAGQFPVNSIARSQPSETLNSPGMADATIAADAQQQPLLSPDRMRRLAEKQRAKHLASRERSSFEARFLHYDD